MFAARPLACVPVKAATVRGGTRRLGLGACLRLLSPSQAWPWDGQSFPVMPEVRSLAPPATVRKHAAGKTLTGKAAPPNPPLPRQPPPPPPLPFQHPVAEQEAVRARHP